jgi:nicotinate-nucleotide--dimethylbenzimidazole phosphoribosyltransferase
MGGLVRETIAAIGPVDAAAMAAAAARQGQLTKPAGSLGRLEALASQLAGMTGRARPRFARPAVIVMAGDHGVARRGVSAYPQAVTAQMVANFLAGGAAINVLARQIGARVVVVDVGVAAELPSHPELRARRVAPGTRDFAEGPAMTRDEALRAVAAGIEVAGATIDEGADLIGTGEMGIGNTTAASAIVAAITGRTVPEVTGRGTGVDDEGWRRKVAVIEGALALHRPDPNDPLGVLAAVGGFEIGGLAGVMLGAAARRVPVVLDGFIAGAAALLAVGLAPALAPRLVAAHRSVEIGHGVALEQLGVVPLLDLDLRLGEGTGAALGMGLCMASCALLDEMATFGEAGVSGQDGAN